MGVELHPHININGLDACEPKTLEVKVGGPEVHNYPVIHSV